MCLRAMSIFTISTTVLYVRISDIIRIQTIGKSAG